MADARAPFTTRHQRLAQLVAGRPRFLLLTRSDLADPLVTQAWLRALTQQGEKVVAICLMDAQERRVLLNRLEEFTHALPSRLVRLVVTGLPNVGKSFLINQWLGRRRLATANRPGVTTAPTWVRVTPHIAVLDTPGVFEPSPRSAKSLYILAALGILPPERYEEEEVAAWLLHTLWQQERVRQLVRERWHVPATQQVEAVALPQLESLAVGRRLLRAGGRPDTARAARQLLTEFRQGLWGRVTLEMPPAPSSAD
ncbi:MAG: 50S ribosome-binding GTPase [Limnochordaceae bacterium]|nr:50S ribosome-binding GTPase [Limnochordaceae bacterium]